MALSESPPVPTLEALLFRIEAEECAESACQPALPAPPVLVSRSLVVAPALAARAGAHGRVQDVQGNRGAEAMSWRPPRAAGAFSNLFVAAESSGPAGARASVSRAPGDRTACPARRLQTDAVSRSAAPVAAHVSTSVGDAVSPFCEGAEFCKGMRGGFLSASAAKTRNIEDDHRKPPGAAPRPSNEAGHNCAKCTLIISDRPLRCSRCQAVFYCSRQCQRQDWESHRRLCIRPDASAGAGPIAGVHQCSGARIRKHSGQIDARPAQAPAPGTTRVAAPDVVAVACCADPHAEFWCVDCGKKSEGPPICCMRCQAAHYCSSTCQRRDQDRHRKFCGDTLSAAAQQPTTNIVTAAIPPCKEQPARIPDSCKGTAGDDLAPPSLEDFLAMLDRQEVLDTGCGNTW